MTSEKGRLTPGELENVLREVGRSLAGERARGVQNGDLDQRLQNAVKALGAIGGAARIEKNGGKCVIRSEGCPLAAAVTEHPEVCRLAEALLSEIIGTEVHERCDREGSPRCRFEVLESKTN